MRAGPVLAAVVCLSACEGVPVAPHPPCARIYWHDLGTARDINEAIFSGEREARPTSTSMKRPADKQSGDRPELDSPLRSARSVELSVQFPHEYEKVYRQAIQRWVQEHLAVEMLSCPG